MSAAPRCILRQTSETMLWSRSPLPLLPRPVLDRRVRETLDRRARVSLSSPLWCARRRRKAKRSWPPRRVQLLLHLTPPLLLLMRSLLPLMPLLLSLMRSLWLLKHPLRPLRHPLPLLRHPLRPPSQPLSLAAKANPRPKKRTTEGAAIHRNFYSMLAIALRSPLLCAHARSRCTCTILLRYIARCSIFKKMQCSVARLFSTVSKLLATRPLGFGRCSWLILRLQLVLVLILLLVHHGIVVISQSEVVLVKADAQRH